MAALHNIFKICNPAVESEITTREYRLMYFYGVWHTKSMIYAESDAEAIYDTRKEVKDAKEAVNGKLPYALFQGNRLVKRFNYTGAAYNPTFTTIK